MSKKKKSDQNTKRLANVVLITAILQLIQAIIELIEKMLK